MNMNNDSSSVPVPVPDLMRATTGTARDDYLLPPHALCIPMPYQSHISAMLAFAKLLHSCAGVRITFVNTEFNHARLLSSRGPTALDGSPHFQFRTIPDFLPPSDPNASQAGPLVIDSVRNSMPASFLDLVAHINDNNKITCIVSDGFISFTADPAAQKLGIPLVHFWSISACSLLGFRHFRLLMEKGLIPLKVISYLTDGYLDQSVECIPGMYNITLKDLPTYLRTTDPDDCRFNFTMEASERSDNASAVVIHTFDALEYNVLTALSSIYSPPVYAIGPLQLLLNEEVVLVSEHDPLKSIQANLWQQDRECLCWLDTREPNSVLYVNFGSIASVSQDNLTEFSMGLANSTHPFLWIIRPDILKGESVSLPPEFFEKMGGGTRTGRGMLSEWCPQEEVLTHSSTGGFLTHCGWSSVIESITAGIPMICWPCFGDQSTNSAYICRQWGIGVELGREVKREEVERVVREVMGGEKGKKMKTRAEERKKLAKEATDPNGSSVINLEKLIKAVFK